MASTPSPLHYSIDGPDDGPTLVMAHPLGADLSIWDEVASELPPGLRLLRYDISGHGASPCPPPPYSMGMLIAEIEALMDAYAIKDAMFVGCSVGGLIAQGLAAKRLDLVRALVLIATAPKIGTRQTWQDRMDALQKEGLQSYAQASVERWFGSRFRTTGRALELRAQLASNRIDGITGVMAAIAGTDFYRTTAALRCPTLVLAGTEDRSTPPDLVRELAELIPGSTFKLLRGAGHVPMVDQPDALAEALTAFVWATGHLTA